MTSPNVHYLLNGSKCHHKDTRVAIKQATNQALNATQGHKHSLQTRF